MILIFLAYYIKLNGGFLTSLKKKNELFMLL